MKKSLITVSFAVLLATAWGVHSKKTLSGSAMSDALLENLEALSYIEEVNGGWMIVDEIPCASSAFEIGVHKSYVNCTTCSKEGGMGDAEGGKCTSVRFVTNPLDPGNP